MKALDEVVSVYVCVCMCVCVCVCIPHLRFLAHERTEGRVRKWRHSNTQTMLRERGEDTWRVGKGSSN